jgi:hypothetical protein
MMLIAENQYYKLAYEPAQNRVYWRMMGFWPSMSAVPNFSRDWDAVQRMTTPGFSLYADLSTLKAMPPDVKDAQDVRQVEVMRGGCSKVAVVIIDGAARAGLNQALEHNGMGKIVKYCSTKAEAHAFLDK